MLLVRLEFLTANWSVVFLNSSCIEASAYDSQQCCTLCDRVIVADQRATKRIVAGGPRQIKDNRRTKHPQVEQFRFGICGA